MTRVLFVCIGNACRSPMAEGFANYYGKGWLTAYSAGSHPAGILMPNTVKAMQEKGIDISHQSSKGLSAVNLEWMDWVVILEPTVSHSIPQNFLRSRRLDWAIQDPVGQSMEVYRRIRDEIEVRVLDFVEMVRQAS